MTSQVHIVVEGLVQGVGFRWFVSQTARKLGVSGYVRNLNNGRVEVFANGNKGMLEELIKSIRIGPRSARVTGLNIDWEPSQPDTEGSGFEIR